MEEVRSTLIIPIHFTLFYRNRKVELSKFIVADMHVVREIKVSLRRDIDATRLEIGELDDGRFKYRVFDAKNVSENNSASVRRRRTAERERERRSAAIVCLRRYPPTLTYHASTDDVDESGLHVPRAYAVRSRRDKTDRWNSKSQPAPRQLIATNCRVFIHIPRFTAQRRLIYARLSQTWTHFPALGSLDSPSTIDIYLSTHSATLSAITFLYGPLPAAEVEPL